jgi:hypothetical protein
MIVELVGIKRKGVFCDNDYEIPDPKLVDEFLKKQREKEQQLDKIAEEHVPGPEDPPSDNEEDPQVVGEGETEGGDEHDLYDA